jgi:hypothetical protein
MGGSGIDIEDGPAMELAGGQGGSAVSSGMAGIEEEANNGLLGHVEYGDGGGSTKVVGRSDCVTGGGRGLEGNDGGGIESITSVS